MKIVFLTISLFVIIQGKTQAIDSLLKIMDDWRLSDEAFSGGLTGKTLPDFEAKDLNGTVYTQSITKNGKASFFNFWYLSCAPCIAEIPNLNRLYDASLGYSNFQFFAITSEPVPQVKKAIARFNIRFPVLISSPKDIHQLTFARGYPVNMLLDKNGKIHTFLSGGRLNPGAEFEIYWKQQIEKILKSDTVIVNHTLNIQNKLDGVTLIDSSKLQSFNDLGDYFSGQSVYIEIWASWCLLCRKELQLENTSVDSFLKENKIVRLYISIDNPQASEIWKSLVREYQPKGYHILASWNFKKEIKQTVYKNSPAIDVPRYIFFKNGKIVELTAYPPDQKERLLKQITEKMF